jgi:subtilisin family serine protease
MVTAEQDVLDLVGLTPLMDRTSGRSEIVIGLVDGPVQVGHPSLGDNIREMGRSHAGGGCSHRHSLACMHGTFVAGILSAKRGAEAPAICPGCTLLVRPIFPEVFAADETVPSATPHELAAAIVELVDAGARLVNLSAALAQIPTAREERALRDAVDHAAARGVMIVAAAGNQPTMGTTVITQHASVIPVVACDHRGRPLTESNLAHSIARRGRLAPGAGINSLSPDGSPLPAGGTSVAAPFVTGAIALVWSEFPGASAARVRMAILGAAPARQPSIVPPLLNAWAIHQAMT